jgi:pimeloyl-ACP methyl ester carboxylesterase
MWGVLSVALVAFSVPPGIAKTALAIEEPGGIVIEAVEYRAAPAAHRRTVILVGDGAEGSGAGAVDSLAEALFARGIDVVTWDKRGTGASSGRWDYGASDSADLLCVVQAVDGRTFGREIGLLGVGTGGLAALEAASRTARVTALALYGVGVHGVPPAPGAWLTPETLPGRFWLWLQGVRIAAAGAEGAPAEPLPALQRLRPRAVFVSVGGRDPRVSRDDARALFEAARVPKEWGYAPGAGERPPAEQIAGRVADFFTRRLR